MAGVLTVEQVAGAVGSPLIILLLGGFLLSRGMESSGAHHRVALSVVRLVGGHRPRQLVMGFMLGRCRSQYVDLQYGIGTDANARCDGRARIL